MPRTIQNQVQPYCRTSVLSANPLTRFPSTNLLWERKKKYPLTPAGPYQKFLFHRTTKPNHPGITTTKPRTHNNKLLCSLFPSSSRLYYGSTTSLAILFFLPFVRVTVSKTAKEEEEEEVKKKVESIIDLLESYSILG